MKLRVSHVTRYDYDHEVGLAPHILYLRPREGAMQRLRSFSIVTDPAARFCHIRDPHDNNLIWAHFWDRTCALNVRTEFEIETFNANPFDFVLKPYAISFPFAYESVFDFALQPYLAPPFDQTQAALKNWLDEHFVDRPKETVPFLVALNRLLFESLAYARREERGIQPSLLTLQKGSGACRDYAVLLCELLRTLGLAARFVSGYLFSPPDDNYRSVGAMHAWVEVYLPGAGWLAIDPTHGIFCNDAFIPVAHAAQAESINPIQGSIASNRPVEARLHVDVAVEKLP